MRRVWDIRVPKWSRPGVRGSSRVMWPVASASSALLSLFPSLDDFIVVLCISTQVVASWFGHLGRD